MAPTSKTTTAKQPTDEAPPEQDLMGEAARTLGMKRREILSVEDTDAGRVIRTYDGHAVIDIPADRPDAAGTTGLAYYPQPGVHVPELMRLPVYTPDASAYAPPRTTTDLDARARYLEIPPEIDGNNYVLWEWVGTDPVRAYALWRRIARQHGMTPQEAGHSLATCIRLRGIVVGAGVAV